MTELVITRGLPASGKTTWAREWVARDRENRARVNRDDLRSMVDDGEWIKGVTEKRILRARDALIRELLKNGVSVVNDDTNLPARTVRDLRKLAKAAGAEFRIVDFTTVPVEVCIDRDWHRDGAIGENVIRDLYRRYLAGQDLPLPEPDEPGDESTDLVPYERVVGAPAAVLVDIDGTVALMADRDPYDHARVHLDRPNSAVIETVQALYRAGHEIIFVSGRSSVCRLETEAWLDRNVGVPYVALHMRADGDYRKDSIVKAEIFDQKIRYEFDVTLVLDDRQQVVDMWRALGLTCLQVAPGDF